jgi:hypothetical protein
MKDIEECPAEKGFPNKPLDGSAGTMASLSMSLQSPDNITSNHISKQMTDSTNLRASANIFESSMGQKN